MNNDLISRQMAIEVVQNRHIMLNKEKDLLINDLEKLPSAQFATDTNVGTKLGIDPHKIERAIRGLTEWQKHVQTESDIDRDISVAVEALKAQLSTNLAEVGTDCISRQAAIDAMFNLCDRLSEPCFRCENPHIDVIVAELEQLPSAQPKRGKWVLVCDNNGMHFVCDKCGAWRYYQEQNFCGECGADMREVTE